MALFKVDDNKTNENDCGGCALSKLVIMTEELEELNQLRREFEQYRQRTRRQADEARLQGRDAALLDFVGLVDDCDRALELIENVKQQRLLEGVQQLRDKTIRRFIDYGLQPFAQPGEIFDHNLHNAVAVKDTSGANGEIIQVHQRGWMREDGTVVRAASVTVAKNEWAGS